MTVSRIAAVAGPVILAAGSRVAEENASRQSRRNWSRFGGATLRGMLAVLSMSM